MTVIMISVALGISITAILVLLYFRGGKALENAAHTDLAIYKAQLRDLERDLQRALIDEAEAKNLRTEIARRILEANQRLETPKEKADIPNATAGLIIGAAVAAVLTGMGYLYLQYGTQDYPDLPLALRIDEAKKIKSERPSQNDYLSDNTPASPLTEIPTQYAELVAELEKAIEKQPNDVRGLRLLAQSQARMAKWDDALAAQSKVISILGDNAEAEDYAKFAEIQIEQANGYVSPEAETALVAALKRDRGNKRAIYYSGLLYFQTARPDQAFRLWAPLLEMSSASDPWVPVLRANLMELAQWAGDTKYQLPETDVRGPTQDDIKAAENMSAEDRTNFISGMIEQLNERLASQGGTAQEWAQLITALARTGQIERAKTIYKEALEVFKDSPNNLERIGAAALGAGLEK